MKKPLRNSVLAGIFFLTVSLFSIACNGQKKLSETVNHPSTVIDLPHEVNEISGLSYKNGFVYAIDDEHGSLYKIALKKDPDVQKWDFGKDRDYEAVVHANGKLYVLNSNGHIVQFEEEFPIQDTKTYDLDLKGKNELESLYFDPSLNKTVALCKDCKEDDKDENTAFSFDIASNSPDKKPLYKIKRTDIEKVAGEKIGRFKPSAAAINPLTHDLYILSSINKIIVVMKNGEVKQVMKLDRSVYKQPEGICFSPHGDMYISNESAGTGPANILVFKKP